MARQRRRRYRAKAPRRAPPQAKRPAARAPSARPKRARSERFSGPVCAVIAAITIGVGIGICYGNLGRAVKVPGEAYQTTDASGPWYRYVVPGVEARLVTLRHLRQVRAALLERSLELGGALPKRLEELVAEGRIPKSALEDGWEEPLRYEFQPDGTWQVSSCHLEQESEEDEP